MKKTISVLFLIFSFSNAFAQFAVVNDKDGWVNIRNREQKSKIIDTLPNGHMIYWYGPSEPNEDNWGFVQYVKNGKYLEGDLYKDRYKWVSDFLPLKISKKTANSVTLKQEAITVTVTKSHFDKKKHKFTYFKDTPTIISHIDGKAPWGTDGNIPKAQYEKISVRIGDKTLILPKAALENVYDPYLDGVEANYDKQNDALYIQTINGDGAGSCLIIWKIEKGVYKDRLIVNGF
ncbi:hypothetical protein PG279_10225 [Riemerella anatipestifer]|nr:hypothetical protein [Riemerella anatipestifer]